MKRPSKAIGWHNALTGKIQGKEENPMLIIRFRHLTELRFDADTQTYSGTVTLGYSFPDDPDLTHRATLSASAHRAHKARYSWIESAVLDAATRRLMERFAEIDSGPDNIFAEESKDIARAA
jgi:hypothetical protein